MSRDAMIYVESIMVMLSYGTQYSIRRGAL